MKKNLLGILAIFICFSCFAQGGSEGLRITRNELTGTARGQAMGGAFGALGGDPTSININPAGLGVYRSSEVSATFNFGSADLTSKMSPDWEGLKNKESKFLANFNNLSLVGYFPTGSNTGMTALNFSFVYNRLKDLNRNYNSSALGMGNSVTDYIASITNGIDNSSFNRYAYNNNEIPWISTLGRFGNFITPVSSNTYQSYFPPKEAVSGYLSVHEKGRVETFDFSIGANFSDDFYLGATFALTDMDYTVRSSYIERFVQSGSIGLANYYRTEGSGYQLKLGAIWRAADFLRIGAAYHSPTWYSLTDTYWADASNSAVGYTEKSPEGRTSYKFYTPSTWVISLAGILGTEAILSLDYEIRDYRGMDYRDRYGDEDGYTYDQNYFINQDYRITSALRIGAEYRFTPQFSGRLGYSFVQNPYKTEYREGWKEEVIYGTIPHYTIEGDINYFTAGVGYRFTPQLYLDAAFIYRTHKDKLYYFSPVWDSDNVSIVESLPAELKNHTYKGMITLGYRF